MKLKITYLNFSKDREYDAEKLLEGMRTYIVEYRKHWWNRWKYIMDPFSGCPRLFFGDANHAEIIHYLNNEQYESHKLS